MAAVGFAARYAARNIPKFAQEAEMAMKSGKLPVSVSEAFLIELKADTSSRAYVIVNNIWSQPHIYYHNNRVFYEVPFKQTNIRGGNSDASIFYQTQA